MKLSFFQKIFEFPLTLHYFFFVKVVNDQEYKYNVLVRLAFMLYVIPGILNHIFVQFFYGWLVRPHISLTSTAKLKHIDELFDFR